MYTQLDITAEQKEKASKSNYYRLMLQGGNHIATYLNKLGERIDIFYLPDEKSVQVTIQLRDSYYVEKWKKRNSRDFRRTEDYERNDVFTYTQSDELMMLALHLWDSVRSNRLDYGVVGGELVPARKLFNALDHVMGDKTAAQRWGLSAGYIKNLCAAGKVKAVKVGKTWVLDKYQPKPNE
jgi:hypothetical protein